MITIKSISNYLLERFQIIPLMILVLTDLMVIKNITSEMIIPIQKFILSFLFIIAYLFHNRVADDQRDFNFDLEFYPERDLQKGILNITLLKKISYIMIIIMLLISILFGNLSLIALMPLFAYTYFSYLGYIFHFLTSLFSFISLTRSSFFGAHFSTTPVLFWIPHNIFYPL